MGVRALTRLATTRLDLRSRTLAVTTHGDEVTVTATLEGPRGAHQIVVVLDREQAASLAATLNRTEVARLIFEARLAMRWYDTLIHGLCTGEPTPFAGEEARDSRMRFEDAAKAFEELWREESAR